MEDSDTGKGDDDPRNSAEVVEHERFLEHLSEQQDIFEEHKNKMEEHDDDPNTVRDTPSSIKSLSENMSTCSLDFESESLMEFDTSSCQGRESAVYEKNYVSKQQELRKNFRDIVKRARKALAEARVVAQEESVAKRYEVATQKKRELQRRRAEKRRKMFSTPTPQTQKTSLISSKVEITGAVVWDKTEIKEIRKIHAELDRARAKKSRAHGKKDRGTSVVSSTIIQPLGKNSEFDKYEIDRLVKELRSLNLPDKASNLAEAFERKVDLERELRLELKRERRQAILEVKRQRLEELARLKEEEKRKRLEERERRELERKKREEEERMRKVEEDRRKKIHNLHMWASFHRAGFDTSVSRPYTTSYFPKLNDHKSSSKSKAHSEYARICSLRLKQAHKPHTSQDHK